MMGSGTEKSRQEVLSANKHVETKIYGQIQGLYAESKIYELGRYYNLFIKRVIYR